MASMATGGDMTILHDELMAIEGVADAQVEVVDDRYPSVRLHIASGADRRQVGALVQQILANHGLRSRLAPERSTPEPQVAPTPPTSEQEVEDIVVNPTTGSVAVRRLSAVAVEEARDQLIVTARDDQQGMAAVQSPLGRHGLRDAIVAAVFELLGEKGAPPTVVAIHKTEEGSRTAITAVLDRGAGDLAVGSAFVTVGWEFGFARAVWAALVG